MLEEYDEDFVLPDIYGNGATAPVAAPVPIAVTAPVPIAAAAPVPVVPAPIHIRSRPRNRPVPAVVPQPQPRRRRHFSEDEDDEDFVVPDIYREAIARAVDRAAGRVNAAPAIPPAVPAPIPAAPAPLLAPPNLLPVAPAIIPLALAPVPIVPLIALAPDAPPLAPPSGVPVAPVFIPAVPAPPLAPPAPVVDPTEPDPRLMCPICLITPANRVTRCGHIFCLDCLEQVEILNLDNLGYIETTRYHRSRLPCPTYRSKIRGDRHFLPETIFCQLFRQTEVNQVIGCGHSFCLQCMSTRVDQQRRLLEHRRQLRFALVDANCPICGEQVNVIGHFFI